jgi:phenylpropionate dioxygenase-like ring-hydroxylating dioxygenase large terminal subunit/AcrR family transcriptional regulator
VAQVENQVIPTGRKQDLIDATMRAIADHGLSNVTLAKVASLAGCTAAAVSFHFNSKEALLTATLRQVAEEFEQALAAALAPAGADPGRALEALLDSCLGEQLTATRKLAVWYAFLSEGAARADYQQLCGSRDDAYFETVLDLCRRIIAGSAQAQRPDALALAYGLIGLIDSLWQEILFTGDDYDRRAARRTCQAYLASVFPWRFAMPAAEVPRTAPAAGPAADPGLAYTLPSWVYDNEEFHALEREHVLRPAWQVVCHVNEIPQPGAYATFATLGERAFVIRDHDGAVRAFHNVCAHRAHAIVQGAAGRCEGYLRCPYHGWTYELDGRNRSVSAPHSFAPFDTGAFGLKALECELFMGFVFIRYAPGGPSVAERMAPYAAELAHYRMADMIPCSELWEEDAPVDWKNAVENYVEDYHFPIGHPGLSALAEREYDREIRPQGVLRLSHALRAQPLDNWSARKYSELLPPYEHLPPGMRRRWSYFGLLPNVFFDIYPDQVDVFQVLPLGPGRLRLRERAYSLPDDGRVARAVRYLNLRLNRRVQHEDSRLTASVQGGLRSSAYRRGILSEKEIIVRGFQDWLRERLPVADCLEPPGSRSAGPGA